MDTSLGDFVNLNCCNQMGEKSNIIKIVESIEALVEEAYEEGFTDAHGCRQDACECYPDSIVKSQLDELKKEVL